MLKPAIHRLRHSLLTVLIIGLLAGCASTPVFQTQQVDLTLTPQQVVDDPELTSGNRILWGGIILETRNLSDITLIEVLAYPLHSSQKPLTDERALGRFMINHKGFVEPTVYAQGRRITVLGEISEIKQGRIGDSDYQYPVILSQQLQLWPRYHGYDRGNIRFGIGISIHN